MDSEAVRVSRLSDLEKEVLRLYLASSDPKEIALKIGRSPHTVEQRLTRARRNLGVRRSLDAAHMLARIEHGPTYEGAIPAVPDVPDDPLPGVILPSSTEGPPAISLRPYATKGRPWNALPISARLLLIAVGMLALTISAVAVANLGETLTRIARHH